jgi:hypothetical protein
MMNRRQRASDDVEEASMAIARKRSDNGIRFLDDEESRQYFDRQARRLMNMSGDEFLRRYDAGKFEAELDGPRHRQLAKLVMLLPFVR